MTVERELMFTFQSCTDLNEIWESIAAPRDIYGSDSSDHLARAERFADKFEQLCTVVADHPDMGLDRDELHPGVRSVAFQRYVLFYRNRGDSVEVLRVLRISRDVTSETLG